MSRQVYVGRLGPKVKREDLQQEFEKHGKIKDIDLRNSHAFIEFEGSDEAREAIQQMDGKRIGGDRITVKQRGRKTLMMIDPKVQGDQLPEMFVSIADAKAIGQMNAKKAICVKPATDAIRKAIQERIVRCQKHLAQIENKRRRNSSSSSSSSSSRSRHRKSRNQKKVKQQRKRSPSSSGSRKSNSSSGSSSYKR